MPPAALVEKMHTLVESDLVADAHALIEIEEIGAAAEQDVLAVVEQFAFMFLIFEGTRPPAESEAGFEQRHLSLALGPASRQCAGHACKARPRR